MAGGKPFGWRDDGVEHGLLRVATEGSGDGKRYLQGTRAGGRGGVLPQSRRPTHREATRIGQAGGDCPSAGGETTSGQPGTSAPGHGAGGDTRYSPGIPPGTTRAGR